MKVIICGSRHGLPEGVTIQDGVDASGFEVTEVVHGAAPGVDHEAGKWAFGRGIPYTYFESDWVAHGKAAGPIRNKAMAEYAEACIAFPGGAGTRNMVKQAREHGLHVYLQGWVDDE